MLLIARSGLDKQLGGQLLGGAGCHVPVIKKEREFGPFTRGDGKQRARVSESAEARRTEEKRAGAIIKRKHTSVVPAQSLIVSAYSTRSLKEFKVVVPRP